jgi:tetratricopeptide (TPR) repeat protein
VTTFSNVETGRAALFRAISNVIARLADGRPVVLIVDDLHQAATGTAEFLGFAVRRVPHLLALASRRPEPGPDLTTSNRITIGPLDLDATIMLVGPERAAALYERSGGHPLFLAELAKASGEDLPASVVASVRAQLNELGPAAQSLEAAAACGRDVDAPLVSALTGRSTGEVLDDLEQATAIGLLVPRRAALAFRHELVREAVEEATTPPRRQAFHRAAVAELSRRPRIDPLALARHARQGGDTATAAAALVAAAERAKERFENTVAEQLLDQAIALNDSVDARLARGRVRIGRLGLDAAREDAVHAIELGAGVAGFELAGWVAYYARDYDTALRYAEEGIARATDDELRASCLALAGRVRHTRGDLDTATAHLAAAVEIASPGIRPVVQVWRGQLLAHLGDPTAAIDSVRRALLDPYLAHPFAAGHGWFTLTYSYAVSGQWSAAMDAAAAFDAHLARMNDKRLPPTAANVRGWLLRGAGQLEAAIELHRFATEATPAPNLLEAHYAALLDIAECHLGLGDQDRAAEVLDRTGDIVDWVGSMSWRHRNRYRLLCARVASLSGAHDQAARATREVAAAAAERGDQRYQHRARILAATVDARAGKRIDPAKLSKVVDGFLPLAGPDGWRDLGELASAADSIEVWQQAETLAADLVKQADGRQDETAISAAVRQQLDAFRP